MTLTELKTLCESKNLNYSFGSFSETTNPPHLIGHIIDSINFGADNVVYSKNNNFMLQLTTNKKDLNLERKIEDEILKSVYWEKREADDADEAIYMVSYFFDIKVN